MAVVKENVNILLLGCWNQLKITDASHVVVILARPGIVNYEKMRWEKVRGLAFP